MNKKFWDGLPADVRGQLTTAMKESTDYANKIAKEENDGALEGIRKSGKTQVYVPTAEERLAFKKALVPVHKKMESRMGGGNHDSAQRGGEHRIAEGKRFHPDSSFSGDEWRVGFAPLGEMSPGSATRAAD